MITELVIIYLTVNSFFMWGAPYIGGVMVSGREYTSLFEFSNIEIIIIMSLGFVIFLFVYLPVYVIFSDDGYVR